MDEYRAYIIGSAGHIANRIDLFCETEEEAKARAKQFVDGHAVELWHGARQIAVFEPKQ